MSDKTEKRGEFRKRFVAAVEAAFDAAERVEAAEGLERHAQEHLAHLAGDKFAEQVGHLARQTYVACVGCGTPTNDDETFDGKCVACETVIRREVVQ